MDTLFLICAGGGGALIVCQLLASLFGIGGDHDHDTGQLETSTIDDTHGADHSQLSHGSWFFSMLSFRSIATGVAFFGLGGLTARYYELADLPTLSAAAFAGFASLYAVASIMNMFRNLKHDGTARIENAVGQVGTVYLRIPPQGQGMGKVTVRVQDRTLECDATSNGGELPTGQAIRVVQVLTPSSVVVEALTQTQLTIATPEPDTHQATLPYPQA